MLEKLRDKSLIVMKDGKVIFESSDDRLKPIVDCIKNHKQDMIGSIVVDKIVGLAAAKLFVLSKVKGIYAKVTSKSAFDYVSDKDVKFAAQKMVNKIMNDSNSEICPMEKLALKLTEQELLDRLLANSH